MAKPIFPWEIHARVTRTNHTHENVVKAIHGTDPDDACWKFSERFSLATADDGYADIVITKITKQERGTIC